MNREKIIQLINKIFVDKFELNPEDLTPEKKIFEDLELDSLDIVDLITGLQHTFQIQLRDNKELLQIRTLQDVYDLVEKIIAEHPEVMDKLEK
ncbi:MAG: acyl carrier protein [Lentisphaeria bacterium]|nr:acyl carrier protein [Lentisphaeria bacterium]